MPTAAKLVATLLFAALAYWVSTYAKPAIDPGRPLRYLAEINALFGAVLGWTSMGPGAGAGVLRAGARGVTTAALALLWSLLFWAGVVMLERSLRLRYAGPVEALEDMAGLMVGYLARLQAPDIAAFAVLGAIGAAMLTEITARRWR